MILIGITGIIGSGKTLALNFFREKKITVFSADEEVKKILEKKIVKDKIYKKFPSAFLRKKIDKNKLALIVFSDKKKLNFLEKIIHPLVKQKKKNFLNKNKKKKIIVMEIPIIFEKKSKKNYDCIILMNTNKKIQHQRVMKRKNMTPQLLKKIMANQIANKKKKYADYIINNNGTKNKTRKILKEILNRIISTAL
ncbi:MAG: dephospho-CoA kinase [Pelagibacteraceae bacterium]|nr:dephospho-CoA kinase [Pelagibacteraceae bacterium]